MEPLGGSMQIQAVCPADSHFSAEELAIFFDARCNISVEEARRGVGNSGLELEQFDTDDATYLIGMDVGVVVTGTCLVATHRPQQSSEVFPSACTVDVRVPRMIEWTCGLIISEYSERCIGPISSMERCHKEGGVARSAACGRKGYSWSVKLTGNPSEIDGRWYVAPVFEATERGP